MNGVGIEGEEYLLQLEGRRIRTDEQQWRGTLGYDLLGDTAEEPVTYAAADRGCKLR